MAKIFYQVEYSKNAVPREKHAQVTRQVRAVACLSMFVLRKKAI
jgi:hypothetical protein